MTFYVTLHIKGKKFRFKVARDIGYTLHIKGKEIRFKVARDIGYT